MSSNIRLQRVCGHCGKEFTAKTTVTQFCGDFCAKRAYKARVKAVKIGVSDEETMAIKAKPIAELKEKEYLNIGEASSLLGISRRTFYRMIVRGEFHAGKAGRRTIIRRADIDGLFAPPPKQLEKLEPVPVQIPDCYHLTEIQIKFGVSESTVQQLIKKHRIPKLRHGKFVYVPKRMIEALLT